MTRSKYEQAVDACSSELPPGLDAWIREYSLEHVFASNLYTTVTWIKNCIFPSASAEAKALTCMDLGLWFYFLDDYDGEDDLSVFDACITLIDGGDPHEIVGFPVQAYRDVMGRVANLPGYSDGYLDSRRDLISWYTWRNPMNQSAQAVSYEDYRRSRQSTIYIRQWIELMCCFRSCSPRGKLVSPTDDLVSTLIEWHILINEVASIDKDRSRGENNLVILRAREEGISLNDALASTLRSLNDVVESYREKYLQLSETAEDEWLRDYLEVIDSSIVGALGTYHENVRRYRSSFGQLELPATIW